MKKFMDAYNKAMEEIVSEAKSEKWVKDVKPKSGAMAKALGVKEGEKVSDKYTSGKKLAKDLVKAVGKKKAQGMLAFAANVSGESKTLFKTALSSLKLIKESDADDIDIPLDVDGTDAEMDKESDDETSPESDEENTETIVDEFSPVEGCKLKLEKYEDGTFEVELEHYFDNEEEAKERFDKTVEWLKAEYENNEKEVEAEEGEENKEEEEKETDEEK